MFESYLLENHNEDLVKILKDIRIEKHFSVFVNFVKLFETDPKLANALINEPIPTLSEFDDSIIKAQQTLIDDGENKKHTKKIRVHARISELVVFPELHRSVFPDCQDLWSFLEISGTVIRITTSKLLEYQRQYICSKCKYISTVKASYEQRFILQAPKRCLNPEECPGKNLVHVKSLENENCKDYQEVKLQEQVSKLSIGSIPTSMWVTLEDDLVDSCKPGDDVTICGIVMRRWRPPNIGKKLDVEIVLRANHVQVNNDQRSTTLITNEIKDEFCKFWKTHEDEPLVARDAILRSFCPQLYGLFLAKLAIAVVLAGGSKNDKSSDTGAKIRSEPHLLLVGDPGTGKSHMLRFASKIIPRSVLTTGIGSTSAGLTVTAVMEGGEWQLEAGALVLADGGICCIDEFNSMKEHDRASIHEAMEQQTISVAKASVVCKLNTRCSILAATNPKGHLDLSEPLCVNVVLASPLLSRFDLILMLQDAIDYEWDEYVCDHIFGSQIPKTKTDLNTNMWSVEYLQAYYIIIKGFHPVLTPEANAILSSYYQAQRQAPTRNVARTTVRLLDSLVRLSQAHARLMYRSEVLVMDALMAVALIESSMQGAALLMPTDIYTIRTPFPDDPMKQYYHIAEVLLEKLQLDDIKNAELQKWQCHPSSTTTENLATHDELPDIPINLNKPKNNIITDISLTQIKKFQFEKRQTEKLMELVEDNPKQGCSEQVENTKQKTISEVKNSVKKNKVTNKITGKRKLNDLDLLNMIPSVTDICDISDINDIPQLDTTIHSNEEMQIDGPYTQERKSKFQKRMKNLREQFAFTTKKLSPNKESEMINILQSQPAGRNKCTEKDNSTKNKASASNSESGSQSYSQSSQKSVKTIFQSEDADIDDLNFDL